MSLLCYIERERFSFLFDVKCFLSILDYKFNFDKKIEFIYFQYIILDMYYPFWRDIIQISLNKYFFTLLELIIVVTVVSVLLTISISAFSTFRSNSNRTGCVSNLSKVNYHITAYQLSHSKVLPSSFGSTTDGNVNHWINYLIKQGADYSIFQCPEMSKDMMFDPAGYDLEVGNIYKNASYIMNTIRLNKWSGADIDSPKGTSCGWGISSTEPVRFSQVVNPAETIYITDVVAGISGAHSGINNFGHTDFGVKATTKVVGLVRRVGDHHSGGFNALFGDGHVEMMQKSLPNQWVAVPNYPKFSFKKLRTF